MLDCLLVDDDVFIRETLQHFAEQHGELRVVGVCSSALEAARLFERQPVPLIVLDVEMPGLTGLEWLRTLEPRPIAILISSNPRYAVDAFEVDVADFLVKPLEYPRFAQAVQRARRRLKPALPPAPAQAAADLLFVRSEGRIVRLRLADVRWAEAQRDYVHLQTATGGLLLHTTMKGLADRLPERDFLRVHRSFLVRIDQIEDIEDHSLVIGKKVIPIGASYLSHVLERLRVL